MKITFKNREITNPFYRTIAIIFIVIFFLIFIPLLIIIIPIIIVLFVLNLIPVKITYQNGIVKRYWMKDFIAKFIK